jgi:hypothetical protein
MVTAELVVASPEGVHFELQIVVNVEAPTSCEVVVGTPYFLDVNAPCGTSNGCCGPEKFLGFCY